MNVKMDASLNSTKEWSETLKEFEKRLETINIKLSPQDFELVSQPSVGPRRGDEIKASGAEFDEMGCR